MTLSVHINTYLSNTPRQIQPLSPLHGINDFPNELSFITLNSRSQNKGPICFRSIWDPSSRAIMLWVPMMGRGGVGRGCSLITRLRICWRADSKARACCTSRSYCWGAVGGYTWHEHRLPRGILLGVCLFILNWYFLLVADDVKVRLVCGQERITRQ